MNDFVLIAKNLFRKKLRAILMMVSILIAFAIFGVLAGFERAYPGQLSGGMAQRAAIARALVNNPEILLLDEPLGSLDALTRSIMQEWLLSIWSQERRTILFITHDIDEAIFLSDRVLLMSVRPGRIKNDIPVPLERPRDHRMTTSPVFTQLKQLIRDEIYEDSLKAERPLPQ